MEHDTNIYIGHANLDVIDLVINGSGPGIVLDKHQAITLTLLDESQ